MSIEAMKQVKVFLKSGDNDVALLFTWDGQAWVCKMDDDFMRELGPLPFDRENDVSCNLMLTSKAVGFKKN